MSSFFIGLTTLVAVVVPPISFSDVFQGLRVVLRLQQTARVKASNEPVKFLPREVEPMSAIASSLAIYPISGLPDGVDVHWETQRRVVWNENEQTREEHELVYEISWVKELGLWRTFLRAHHKMRD